MSKNKVSVSDIPRYLELLPHLRHPWVVRVFTKLLQRSAGVLGYQIYWDVPEKYVPYADDYETQRALRITSKLLAKGYFESARMLPQQYADEPQAYISFISLGENYGLGWSGKSVHLFDSSPTYWPALGEAVERLCTIIPHHTSKELINSSYANLHSPKVDIFDIAGLTPEQREQGDENYELQYDKDTVFTWAPVDELTKKQTLYAPWQLFSFKHVQQNVRCLQKASKGSLEPLLQSPITTGAAAGQDLKSAQLAGVLEVIERDAFIIYWLNQMQAKRIDLEAIANDEIQELLNLAKRYRLEVHLLYLATDVPVHTISLVVIDRTGVGPALTITAKTGFSLESMIISVLHDTLGQQGGYRNMFDSHTLTNEQLDPQKLGHLGRIIYWCHSRHLPKIEHFIGGNVVKIDSLPTYSSGKSTTHNLAYLLDWFREQQYEVLAREIITPELKEITEGMSVVVVRILKMQPVYLYETHRSTQGKRLRDVPKRLGFTLPSEGPDPFYKEPHPFP